MVSDRFLKVFVVIAVGVAARYSGHEAGSPSEIAVAMVGLPAAFWRPVLGIPVALVMTATAVHAPVVAVGVATVALVVAILAIPIKVRRDLGYTSGATPGDGASYFGPSDGFDGGGGCDAGL